MNKGNESIKLCSDSFNILLFVSLPILYSILTDFNHDVNNKLFNE